MPVGPELSDGDQRRMAAGLSPGDERLVEILNNFADGTYAALSQDVARSAAVRIAHSKHEHDQQLELEYAKSDALRSLMWHRVITDLRLLTTLRPGSAHCDFNAMRYWNADTMATQFADMLEPWLQKQDWYKV